jgi:hypothetical protein
MCERMYIRKRKTARLQGGEMEKLNSKRRDPFCAVFAFFVHFAALSRRTSAL